MILLPDLGIYLVERGQTHPFRITVFNRVMLGLDSVLGWMINGDTRQSIASGTESHSAPILIEPMAFTIYLGQISKTQAQNILQRLRNQGLLVVPRPEHKYLVPDGTEWVIPLEYLPPEPLNHNPFKNIKSKRSKLKKGFGT